MHGQRNIKLCCKIKCCLFKLWSWIFSSLLDVLMVPGYLTVFPLLEAGVFLTSTLLIILCDSFTNTRPPVADVL